MRPVGIDQTDRLAFHDDGKQHEGVRRNVPAIPGRNPRGDLGIVDIGNQNVGIVLQRDEEDVLNATLSDEFDPETLLDTDESLYYHRPGISRDVVRKLRSGAWIVQAQLDLHGMRRDEARDALAEFIREAGKKGLRCLRVIHGKGLGSIGKEPVLKGKVRAWLVQKEEVIAFCEARGHDGGAGAVLVLLQPLAAGADRGPRAAS